MLTIRQVGTWVFQLALVSLVASIVLNAVPYTKELGYGDIASDVLKGSIAALGTVGMLECMYPRYARGDVAVQVHVRRQDVRHRRRGGGGNALMDGSSSSSSSDSSDSSDNDDSAGIRKEANKLKRDIQQNVRQGLRAARQTIRDDRSRRPASRNPAATDDA